MLVKENPFADIDMLSGRYTQGLGSLRLPGLAAIDGIDLFDTGNGRQGDTGNGRQGNAMIHANLTTHPYLQFSIENGGTGSCHTGRYWQLSAAASCLPSYSSKVDICK